MNSGFWASIFSDGSHIVSELIRYRRREKTVPEMITTKPTQPTPVSPVSSFEKRVEPPPSAPAIPSPVTTLSNKTEPVKAENQTARKGKACLPCVNSHGLACVGLLNEAYRMSPDGLNEEAIERVQKCLSEIAAAERVDLSPDNIAKLPDGERPIAEEAAKKIREIRHGLEWLQDKEQLGDLAVKTSNLSQYVGKEWFKLRVKQMSPEKREQLAKAAVESLAKDEP